MVIYCGYFVVMIDIWTLSKELSATYMGFGGWVERRTCLILEDMCFNMIYYTFICFRVGRKNRELENHVAGQF